VTKKIETPEITLVVTNESIGQLRSRCREVIKQNVKREINQQSLCHLFQFTFPTIRSVVLHHIMAIIKSLVIKYYILAIDISFLQLKLR